MLKNKLVQRYKKNCWAGIISDIANNQTGKLHTYALFKTYIYKEKYLSVIKNREIRKCVTAFRNKTYDIISKICWS